MDEATDIYASICQILKSNVCCESVENSLSSIKNQIAVLPEKLTEEDQDQFQYDVSYDDHIVPMLTESTIRKLSPFKSHFTKAEDLALSEITEESIENE